ncbi:putative spermidine/putrescine transport system ATP-binding protein/thiamine transport system ATP-binding protein [Nocardiopsis flavescens]|uniref:ABC-type quaternary amine transporter n=1 Tax=Nocardiopsis flavescens TaxID=758803 RepID=A0A1M6BQN1_9ACTN|nr:ABC transporter ATP-binding protein [Nocardiopsis flavescens]SHI50996.1 putative spermidine/putrescine transport system ATP-binding protein/thiamine transport system ATP-binding protein [Nocardiopsis flavescens]
MSIRAAADRRSAPARAEGLAVDGLTVHYGSTAAVRGVSLDVAPAETVAVIGPSGCGKSTTLRAVAGLVPVSGGAVSLAGRDVTGWNPSRRNIGLVPQNYAVFPHMSVAANIAYGLRARGTAAARRRERVREMLEVTRLTDLAQRRPDQLSGGQRQRVALARALAIRPDALLLDEPLAALDPQLRGGLRRELAAMLAETDCATLIVTHDQQEALSLGSRIALLREGRLVQFDTPRRLWDDPADAFVADFLAGAVLLDAVVDDGHALALDGRWRVPVRDLAVRPTAHGSTRLLLRHDSLTVTDDPARAVLEARVTHSEFTGDGVRLTVRAGEQVLGVRVPPDARVGGSVSLAVAPGRAVLLTPGA